MYKFLKRFIVFCFLSFLPLSLSLYFVDFFLGFSLFFKQSSKNVRFMNIDMKRKKKCSYKEKDQKKKEKSDQFSITYRRRRRTKYSNE